MTDNRRTFRNDPRAPVGSWTCETESDGRMFALTLKADALKVGDLLPWYGRHLRVVSVETHKPTEPFYRGRFRVVEDTTSMQPEGSGA